MCFLKLPGGAKTGVMLGICPKKIPINDIFRLINTETIDGKIINRNAKMFYLRNVLGKGKASDCIKCGRCEDICSQKIEIRNELEKAAEIFETKRTPSRTKALKKRPLYLPLICKSISSALQNFVFSLCRLSKQRQFLKEDNVLSGCRVSLSENRGFFHDGSSCILH